MKIVGHVDSSQGKELKSQIFSGIADSYRQHAFYGVMEFIYPDLHLPLADLWSSACQEKKIELNRDFQEQVRHHIIAADDASNQLLSGYFEAIELEPDKKDDLFEEYRSRFIEQLKAKQPFRYLFIDFWTSDPNEVLSACDRIEMALFTECNNFNQPFKIGLILLQTVYEIYFVIEKLNSLRQLVQITNQPSQASTSQEDNAKSPASPFLQKIQSSNPNEVRQTILEVLRPLSGLNPQKRKIMSDED